jgi:hypothetical protein
MIAWVLIRMDNCRLSCNKMDTEKKKGTEVAKERFQSNIGDRD